MALRSIAHWLASAARAGLSSLDRLVTLPPKVRVPWDPRREFLVVAHRGAAASLPENTLPAFDAAIESEGANAIEADVCVTADGEAVVWHDWDPDSIVSFVRQSGAEPWQAYRPHVPPFGDPLRRKVSELTLAELRAHYGYCPRRGKDPCRALIPTVDELFAWAAKKPALRVLFVDVKVPEDEAALAATLAARLRETRARHPLSAEVVLLSPVRAVAETLHRELPGWSFSWDLDLGVSLAPGRNGASALEQARAVAADHASVGRPNAGLFGWHRYRKIVDHDMAAIGAAETEGREPPVRRYLCWTINERREIRQLVRIGVHGMLTDRPRLVRRLVAARHGHTSRCARSGAKAGRQTA